MIDRSKDTILIERWHTLYRDRAKIDSVYINKVDSIPYPVTVEKQVTVEKKLTWWQKARLYLANVTIAALLIVGAYLLVRWYLRKKIPNI
jgi:late competence protein required for DNA uptake (superfamily II DNA/RNA helicase)